MENCDGSGEVAEVSQVVRDVTQNEAVRCSAIQRLSDTIARSEADEKKVAEAIRICAAVANDQSKAVRNAAMRSLEPTIRERAKLAVKGSRLSMASDFLETSSGLIFERLAEGKYAPEIGGSFRGWCYTVLRREWISLIRKSKTDALGHMETGNQEVQTLDGVNHMIEDSRPFHEKSMDLRKLRDSVFAVDDLKL